MTHSVIHRTEMFDAHLDLGGQPIELSEYATTGLVALAVAPRGQGKTGLRQTVCLRLNRNDFC